MSKDITPQLPVTIGTLSIACPVHRGKLRALTARFPSGETIAPGEDAASIAFWIGRRCRLHCDVGVLSKAAAELTIAGNAHSSARGPRRPSLHIGVEIQLFEQTPAPSSGSRRGVACSRFSGTVPPGAC